MSPTSADEFEMFDPAIHLDYSPPAHLFSLADLQLEQRSTSTPIAATAAFPFLSHEGVLAYRGALFSDETLENCSVLLGANALILRNAGGHSKFLHDLWNHPETLKIMSKNMKVPLISIMQMEEAFVSVQTDSYDIEEMKEISKGATASMIPIRMLASSCSVTPKVWWEDKHTLNAAIRRSRKLKAQAMVVLMTYKAVSLVSIICSWNWNRDYVMGDELLRQGQREIFYEWVKRTGLWDLRS
ncbi:uncharacterized protein RSE6_12772 [Rhynchosporium secalis]|uniref:Uncharacterized protein n=1 Tax=Rhynchosporium secalis TaxID=38038 RepID=A0A1E1MR98_RHYSE|nr:uncharacterized protein RSE6_12772 [Rhynchosporium secalis]